MNRRIPVALLAAAALASSAALLLAPAGLAAPALAWEPGPPTRIAAGLHDGNLVGPRIRPDGTWLAYGLLEERADGTVRTRYYARSLGEDGTFRAIWPKQHPSFEEKEGTASFSDLLDFQWHPGGSRNAMVVRHKTKGEEVMLELVRVRFGGPGAQEQPVFSKDGGKVIVAAEGELGREMWIADTVNNAELEQLTFTRDSERWADFDPAGVKVLHEIRNRSTSRSDLFIFDLEYYEQQPLVRLPDSDEIHPSWSPDGSYFVFLSNKDDPAGKRYDLFRAAPGDAVYTKLAQGVRVTERARGYCWDPSGQWLLYVQDRPGDHPIAVVPTAGGEPKVIPTGTRDNREPDLTVLEDGTVRLTWIADDTKPRAGRDFQIAYLLDMNPARLRAHAGVPQPPAKPAE